MASIVSAQRMKAAVSERKRRLFLTFMWVYGGGYPSAFTLTTVPATDRGKTPSGNLVPEGGSLCLILPLFGYAEQLSSQKLRQSPALRFTAPFQFLFLTAEFAVIPVIDVLTPRVTETVSVNILVFAGLVVETPV